MAERVNKFKQMYKGRKETTLTDEIADQLYEQEDTASKDEVPATKISDSPAAPAEEKIDSPATPVRTPIVPTAPRDEPQNTKPSSKAKADETKKPGRPRKYEDGSTMFNFRISNRLKEMTKIASSAKGLSLTDYFEKLIEEDYEKNKDYYDIVKSRMLK